jgi:hypothetical protein
MEAHLRHAASVESVPSAKHHAFPKTMDSRMFARLWASDPDGQRGMGVVSPRTTDPAQQHVLAHFGG